MADSEEERRVAAAANYVDSVESGFRFLHLIDAQTSARVDELSATLHAVVETLVGEGLLPLDKYESRKRLTVLRENDRQQNQIGLEICNVADKYALSELPEIDCEARLPLCEARCCRLPFVLSPQDLDERQLSWNYGRPYRLSKRADGMCVHNEHGGCGVYDARPAQCRIYDCREDRRIWLDFEARIPAP